MRASGESNGKQKDGAGNGAPYGASSRYGTDESEQRPKQGNDVIVVIDPRRLLRECLVHFIEAGCHAKVVAVASIEDWVELERTTAASLFVLTIANPDNEETKRDIARVVQVANGAPTVALSDSADLDQIVAILGQGVRGYIPLDFSLVVAIAALALVRAGGTFVPAASLVEAQRDIVDIAPPARTLNVTLSPRQIAVLDLLRLGKANKIIAYDLAMREGTVKVHVRNIMKKLNAKNRTEVAVLANHILNSGTNTNNGRAGKEHIPTPQRHGQDDARRT